MSKQNPRPNHVVGKCYKFKPSPNAEKTYSFNCMGEVIEKEKE